MDVRDGLIESVEKVPRSGRQSPKSTDVQYSRHIGSRLSKAMQIGRAHV